MNIRGTAIAPPEAWAAVGGGIEVVLILWGEADPPEGLARLMRSHGVAVNTVGVGSDLPGHSTRSLSVRDLVAPEEVESFNRLPITATVAALGIAGTKIKVACRFGDEMVGIETTPEEREALRERLQGRGQDSEEIIERRMRDAVSESSHYDESDYLIINDDFTAALDELSQLIITQRLKTSRQAALFNEIITDLLA